MQLRLVRYHLVNILSILNIFILLWYNIPKLCLLYCKPRRMLSLEIQEFRRSHDRAITMRI